MVCLKFSKIVVDLVFEIFVHWNVFDHHGTFF
jgi:hypothetical protein